jgi:outer membrane protein assembly factor BamB
MLHPVRILVMLAAVSAPVEITSPQDGGVYSAPDLGVRVVVDWGSEMADSVVYSLNGGVGVEIPRLDTDWYTYLQNDLHHGWSESPAPHTPDVLWTAAVSGPVHEFVGPVVVDGVVYFVSDYESMARALDAATGEILWEYDVVNHVDDAVTVKDGLVYVPADSAWCLEAGTGQRVWAYKPPGVQKMNGTPAVVDGMACFTAVTEYTQCLVCMLDAADGGVLWIRDLGTTYTTGSVTIWNGLVLVPTSGGPLYALDVSDGSTVWTNTDSEGGYWDTSPTVMDGVIYIGGEDYCVHAIEASTGKLSWETSIGGRVESTPAVHDGRVFAGCAFPEAGTSMNALSMEDGEILWTVPGAPHGSPAVADGLVFWGDYRTGLIHAADEATGESVWTYTAESVLSSPAVVDGVMYVAATDWNLYAFGTGLKYSYHGAITAQVGTNTLTAAAWDSVGGLIGTDSISFIMDPQGVQPQPSPSGPRLACFPNPFSSRLSVSFSLPAPGRAAVTVYDIAGRRVRSLCEGTFSAGRHSVVWNGRMDGGRRAPAGMYLVRTVTHSADASAAVCLLR